MRGTLDPVKEFFNLKPRFSHMPGLALGATDSAHEVFFGRDAKQVVAVKHFQGLGAAERANHELEMLRTVRGLGFLTLTPVRIEETRSGTLAYLLTKYEPDLTSMSAVAQRKNQAADHQVARTARTLGDLHAAGVSHGDAQIKNFGIMPTDKRRVVVFDFEKGGTDAGGHFKSDPFTHDVESLVQSLAHKTYGGTNVNQAAEAVLTNVIEPYQSAAAAGLGDSRTLEIGYRALNTHLAKHTGLHGQ